MKCRIEGCVNDAGVPGSAMGLCRAHYRRWQRYGDENEPLRRIVSWKGETCSEIGCNNTIEAHGLCENHYKKEHRRKYPGKVSKTAERFRQKRNAKQEKLMGRKRPDSCEICGSEGYGRKPSIVYDHDHQTGEPRGWLCDRCNKVLGLVKDNPELLIKLGIYLRNHNAEINNKAKKKVAKIRLCLAG
jgi:hypothetical protein